MVFVSVEMSAYTCSECAGTYAYPKSCESFCPFCTNRLVGYKSGIIVDQQDEIDKLNRQISAHKGVITKLKNKFKEDCV